jgi:hypothetical protein
VHDLDAVQATAIRPLSCAPAGLGVRWRRHVVPFHRSATVTGPELVKFNPTAEQAEDAEHPTPFRKITCAPAGFGVGWILQLVPFHRSASVPTGKPELSVRAPTAVQVNEDVQATPSSPPPSAGLGVGWMRHLAPSHRSARVPWLESPTAVHADGAVQDTPFKKLNCAPAGLGAGWIRHFLPSHRSARFTWVPEPVT